MPSDSEPGRDSQLTPAEKRAQRFASSTSLALELPFTLAGAVVVGGVIGYFLDRWLHTQPWLMLLLGGLGFYAGLREVLRRMGVTGGEQSR